VAYLFFKKIWFSVYQVLLLTMLVDVDHLIADPIFELCRCSIGFHPLHSYIAIMIYMLLLLVPKLRVAGIGLLMHMATDAIDCIWSKSDCI